jgi:hypothetical protein
MASRDDSHARGAYGLELPDVPNAADLLVPAPTSWASWRLAQRAPREAEAQPADAVGADVARVGLSGGGWVELDRRARTSTLVLAARPADREMVHPYLASTAAVCARWRGWNCVHSGGVVLDGGAWGVLGDKEAGKSSTVAWLALEAAAGVLCDDVLVIDSDGHALAGPRCIDLREDAARHLGVGEALGVVGARERWRMRLEPTPPTVPLRGWIELAWGDELALDPFGPTELLPAIVRNFSVRLMPPDVDALMDLAALPAWRLTRPRRFDALPDAGELLLDALDG